MVIFGRDGFAMLYKDDSSTQIGADFTIGVGLIMASRTIESTDIVAITGDPAVKVRYYQVNPGLMCKQECATCTANFNPTACSTCISGYTHLVSNNSCPIDCTGANWRRYSDNTC